MPGPGSADEPDAAAKTRHTGHGERAPGGRRALLAFPFHWPPGSARMPDGTPLGAPSGINLPLLRHDTRRSLVCLGEMRNEGLQERHREGVHRFETHEPSRMWGP